MASNIPIIVQGNSFNLAIPLQIYVIQNNEMVLQDYTPDPTDDVRIQLKGCRRNYAYTPTVEGNVAKVYLTGNELADNYAVVVSIVKANGQRLRSFRTDQFFIVESSDDLTVDDIVQGLEENVIYLNAQAFISLGEVVISDSTTTFDANSALSAKQGAILRENIELILSSLGEYAFPVGKPTLDWSGGTLAVTLNLTDFSSSNMAETTQRGSAYTTTLTPAHSSNLYVNDVVIKMSGVDITAMVYNENTGAVSIPEVSGSIEITATQETYIQDGLVFNLDGLNRGGTSGHWVDVVGNVDFTLTDCTENTDNIEFNGTSSKGLSDGSLNVACTSGTIESLYDLSASDYPTTSPQIILMNPTAHGCILLGLWKYTNLNKDIYVFGGNSGNTFLTSNTGALGLADKNKNQVSIFANNGKKNNEALTDFDAIAKVSLGFDAQTRLSLGYRKRSSGENFMKGKIHFIRVYSRQLTDAERTHNYNIDKKRFNLT